MNVAVQIFAALASLAFVAPLVAADPFDGDDWRVVCDYGFDEMVNDGGNPRGCDGAFPESLSCFGGNGLYMPKYTNGVVQISASGGKLGVLSCGGEGVSPENTLFVLACRLTSTKKVDLAVDCVSGCSTNNLAVRTLERDNMAWHEIELSRAQKGGILLFRPDETAKDPRILIDRIVFARRLDNAFCIILK